MASFGCCLNGGAVASGCDVAKQLAMSRMVAFTVCVMLTAESVEEQAKWKA